MQTASKILNQAVVLHTLAGHFAQKELGARAMTATSIIDSLESAFKYFSKQGDE